MSETTLTVKEFADAIGYCDKTVRRKLAAGQIPGAYRFGDTGTHWRIPKDAVDKVKGDK